MNLETNDTYDKFLLQNISNRIFINDCKMENQISNLSNDSIMEPKN